MEVSSIKMDVSVVQKGIDKLEERSEQIEQFVIDLANK